ncbi:hypothetical protein E2C01_088452 [Portunus trituberculatus]|uniref:Uncharacterized protein n=1 Tax=Portunus trituberculatus TaxID=210409 RepID=A0A5B7JJW5_PORTR|nr:hypothetical protein [Portunus trituberculatus]
MHPTIHHHTITLLTITTTTIIITTPFPQPVNIMLLTTYFTLGTLFKSNYAGKKYVSLSIRMSRLYFLFSTSPHKSVVTIHAIHLHTHLSLYTTSLSLPKIITVTFGSTRGTTSPITFHHRTSPHAMPSVSIYSHSQTP